MRKEFLIGFCIVFFVFISCLNQNAELIECGTKRYNKQNDLVFEVECDSISGVKKIFEKVSDIEHIETYLLEDIEVSKKYHNHLNKKFEYSGFYKDSMVFYVKRTPGYTESPKNEKVTGVPIIQLSNNADIKSNIAFFFFKPLFVDSAFLSTYKVIFEDSLVIKQNRYPLKNEKNILNFEENIEDQWVIELEVYFNSGRKYMFRKKVIPPPLSVASRYACIMRHLAELGKNRLWPHLV